MLAGPLPLTGIPRRTFFSSDLGLEDRGYVEEEFFYTTRMVVRRPARSRDFNGTVVVEWLNATSNYDVEALWFRTHEYFLREGTAWVGITAQSGPITHPTLGVQVGGGLGTV